MAWYISLAYRWHNEFGENPEFRKYCDELEIPWDHVRIPFASRHSTLFAFARIEKKFFPHRNLRESALAVMDYLKRENLDSLVADLQGFTLRPSEVRVYDHDTTVQFDADPKRVCQMREIISERFTNLDFEYKSPDVQLPMNGGTKNSGPLVWGSVARNPLRTGKNDLRQTWDVEEEFASELSVTEAILTVSDDGLTNKLLDGDFIKVCLER